MKEKLNNPISDSGKEQSASGTELDGKGKKEELLAGKFKTQEDLVKGYQDLEADHTRKSQESAKFSDRLAKLEGKLEAQKEIQVTKPPVFTPEERKKMDKQFKTDFTEDSLTALWNFNAPLRRDVAAFRDELKRVRDENATRRNVEQKREAKTLIKEARGEGSEAKKFDELRDSIEKELREDENLSKYENPYTAAFNKVLGKSYRSLAKGTDAERKSFVEGASPVPPKVKKDEKGEYKKRILEAGDDTRL